MTLAANPMVVERSALGRLEHLANGGTARVFRCPDLQLPELPALVFKEYKVKTRKLAGPSLLPGLLSLARFRDQLNDKQRDGWDRKLIWPLRVVVDNNAPVGTLMKLIPAEYFVSVRALSGEADTTPAEIALVLGADEDAARFNMPKLSVTKRLALCSQIVATFALVHQRHLIVGDVSARNLVFHDGPMAPRVLLVDCDSYRLKNVRAAFGAQPHTGSWEPPECLDAANRLKVLHRTPGASQSEMARLSAKSMTQSEETDVYKVGLLVVRILDHGRGKTRNRNPEAALQILEAHMGRGKADVLRGALDPDPANRPKLIDWHYIWHDKPARLQGTAAHGLTSGGAPTPATPGPAQPPSNNGNGVKPQQVTSTTGPPQGQRINGNWEWVEGKGWSRRNAGPAVGQP